MEGINEIIAAAEKGDVTAQTQLGKMYHKGQGVAQDYDKALYWHRKAAEQKKTFAENYLGNEAQEYAKAVNWLLGGLT